MHCVLRALPIFEYAFEGKSESSNNPGPGVLQGGVSGQKTNEKQPYEDRYMYAGVVNFLIFLTCCPARKEETGMYLISGNYCFWASDLKSNGLIQRSFKFVQNNVQLCWKSEWKGNAKLTFSGIDAEFEWQ